MNTIPTNENSHLFVFRNRFIFLVFLLIFSVPIASFAKESPVLTLRSLGAGEEEKGLNLGYQFEIYENGFVRYNGKSSVKVKGERTAKITPKQVQQLIVTYKAIDNFFKENGWYDEKNRYLMPRYTHYVFKLHYQGEVSEILPGGFANVMFINLNKMIPVKDWVCLPRDEYQLCPLKPLSSSIYPID